MLEDMLRTGICWVGSHQESFNEPGYGSRYNLLFVEFR